MTVDELCALPKMPPEVKVKVRLFYALADELGVDFEYSDSVENQIADQYDDRVYCAIEADIEVSMPTFTVSKCYHDLYSPDEISEMEECLRTGTTCKLLEDAKGRFKDGVSWRDCKSYAETKVTLTGIKKET